PPRDRSATPGTPGSQRRIQRLPLTSSNPSRAQVITDFAGALLRDLAKAIVASGGLGCEQETLYNVVPPTLARELAKLE
ncbi:MAG: hypothetical protein M3Y33_19445, partial [Actinomycetota bacterium]|nr:hypothetical protein [Actinomycetota bacterium]